MRKLRTIFRLLIPLALLTGTSVTASVAAADPTTGPRDVISAAPHAAVAAAVPSCPITIGGRQGAMKCDTLMLSHRWPDGRLQYFVIGTTTSNNIYHIYQLPENHSVWSNWTTVPGNGTAVDGIVEASYDPLIIEVLGTTGLWYCNRAQSASPGWTGWYQC